MIRFLFLLVPLVASALAPTPRSSQRLPGQKAGLSAESSGSSARTATSRTQTAKPLRPSGRTPSFTSQDLTNLVKNELAPKPWLPPTLSFRTDFPKTVAAVNELKGSVKASVADLKKSVSRSVEAVPIYRSAQSIARRVVPLRRTDAAPRSGAAQDAPAAPPRRSGRAPGLTSQDVATFVERELPSSSAKAKD